MSSYTRINYNGYIAPCNRCGGEGYIMGWDDGIGDVGCHSVSCRDKNKHYSGSCCTKKREAIRQWNNENQPVRTITITEKELKDAFRSKKDFNNFMFKYFEAKPFTDKEVEQEKENNDVR